MTGLIVFFLIVVLAVYAVFFLFFKLIWILFKRNKNTWPLVLAGVSTVLCGVALVGAAMWGVHKIMQPFRPLQQRILQDPQPVYGVRTYTDPVYHFTVQLPDGMDYSEWISLAGAELKLGINTNLFKKDASGNEIKGPVVLSAFIRQTNGVDTQNPFGSLQAELTRENTDRRLKVDESTALTLAGQPAFYASGTLYTNRGPLPMWMQAIYQDGAIIYVLSTEVADRENTPGTAHALVSSLQPVTQPAVENQPPVNPQ